MNNFNKYIIAAAVLGMAACKPSLKTIEATKGSADFTKYVALGNSLTAGYTDGAVYKEGQLNSYPRMLAEQFALAGGGELKTPYVADEIGNNGQNEAKYVLVINPATSSAAPVRATGTATSLSENLSTTLYNHLGIPGARAVDATLPAALYTNPFLTRLVGPASTRSMLSMALENKPTFFTYWLGANDVLLWTTAGGAGNVQSAPNTLALPGELSHPGFIANFVGTALDSLTKNGAKGLVSNIPDVTTLPFFTTVPVKCIPLSDTNTINALNAGYAAYNAGIPATAAKIVFTLGANAPVIADPNAPLGLRQATSSDLICLTASSFLGKPTPNAKVYGLSEPLPDNLVLDNSEIALANDVTSKANIAIKQLADAKGLAFFDASEYLKTVKSGILWNGAKVTTTFVTGGAFSLDGVHPTPRGYALIANQMILAINGKYGSTIPMVEVNKYRGIALP